MTSMTSALKSIRTLRIGVGEWLALGAALSFAGASSVLRGVAIAFDPLSGTVIRLLPLALFSLGMMALRRNRGSQVIGGRAGGLGWRSIGWLAFARLVATPVAHLSLFLSLRYSGLLVAVPAYSTQQLFSALLAIPVLGETFSKRLGAGIVVSLLGITLLSYGQQTGVSVSTLWPLGIAFGLLTGVMWGIRNSIGARLLRMGLELFTWHGITTTASVAIIALILAASGNLQALSVESITSVRTLLIAGVMTALGQYLIFAAVKRTTVASASMLKSLDVVFTSLVAVVLLGEVINLSITLAIVLIFSGVIIVQLAKGPKPTTAPTIELDDSRRSLSSKGMRFVSDPSSVGLDDRPRLTGSVRHADHNPDQLGAQHAALFSGRSRFFLMQQRLFAQAGELRMDPWPIAP